MACTPEYADYDPIANKISDPILKVIVRYRNHSSILAIEEVCKKSHKLSFSSHGLCITTCTLCHLIYYSIFSI